MKLVSIPKDKYDEYRLSLMFDCYKWDPQFLDNNTIAKSVLIITEKEHEELKKLTEQLDEETRQAEMFLNNNLQYTKPLELPFKLRKEIKSMKNYEPDKHLRLMRYDFHPIADGKWAVSEVNSDVPGGFAEGTLMPKLALEILGNKDYSYKSFGDIFVRKLICKLVGINKDYGDKVSIQEILGTESNSDGFFNIEENESIGNLDEFFNIEENESIRNLANQYRIMLVHCTSYSDDRQVMQFLGDRLKQIGFQVIYGAADHLNFKDNIAYSILDGNEGKIDVILRFTPLEWVKDIKPKRWQGYFDTYTLSCNHPVAIFAQTKRFPFVWDLLEQNGISMATWRKLLPDTLEVRKARGKEGYIYKPAYGRVGEKISIKEACKGNEYKKIMTDVKLHPKKYLAQKRFESMPVKDEFGNEFHVCLGSYTVDGSHAGYYARVSDLPRIDSNAADIPVLIEK